MDAFNYAIALVSIVVGLAISGLAANLRNLAMAHPFARDGTETGMPRVYTPVANDSSIECNVQGGEFSSSDGAAAGVGRTAIGLSGQHLGGELGAVAVKLFVEDAPRHRVAIPPVIPPA